MYKRRERPYQKIKNDTRTLVLAGDQKSIIIMKLPGAEPSSILRDYGTFVP